MDELGKKEVFMPSNLIIVSIQNVVYHILCICDMVPDFRRITQNLVY